MDPQQPRLFDSEASTPAALPPGLVFVPEFLADEEQRRLLAYVRTLDFKEFVMHGVTARRRVAHFGFGYSYGSRQLTGAPPIPEELESLRRSAASVIAIDPESFREVLVTEYQPGAGIGWHRDAPSFGIVAGISLASAVRMRFRPREDHAQVLTLDLPAGSFYVLDGPARRDWEHVIPPVKAARYSITFRTLKNASRPARH
ncbi:MAG TPA: alpha-ketoglutarate-dependent dioxygenase AlkB [Bryobacteraceae bacterium]|nr:alpha-ketoglutarate-dependent dioxygenase AlkB [Bryobacteraceae bacterium]